MKCQPSYLHRPYEIEYLDPAYNEGEEGEIAKLEEIILCEGINIAPFVELGTRFQNRQAHDAAARHRFTSFKVQQ